MTLVCKLILLAALVPLLLTFSGCAPRQVSTPATLQLGSVQQPLEISGILARDQRLGGVIRLTADLVIPLGRTLRIEAGSQLLVVGTDSTKIDPEVLDKGTEILVRGRLEVAGEAGAPVRFALDPATPAGENWAGIELIGAQAAVLTHLDIFSAEIGLLSVDSHPRLEQVNILGARSALLLQGRGSLTYRGGRISGGDTGLLCFDQQQLSLNQVQIADNQEEGLYLAPGCALSAQDLAVERNDLGLVAPASAKAEGQMRLSGNRIDFKPLAAGVLR
jgi:hypothetical protein